MKYNIFYMISFSIVLYSCKTQKIEEPEKISCRTYQIEDLKQVSYHERFIEDIFNKSFNEVRFCNYHPSIIAEITYEKSGKWNKIIRTGKKKPSILLWNNIYIEGIGKPLNFATTTYDDKFSAVMIFDDEGNDMLSNTSGKKVFLINYLIYEINSYDKIHKSDYSKESWKAINLKSYKKHHFKDNYID